MGTRSVTEWTFWLTCSSLPTPAVLYPSAVVGIGPCFVSSSIKGMYWWFFMSATSIITITSTCWEGLQSLVARMWPRILCYLIVYSFCSSWKHLVPPHASVHIVSNCCCINKLVYQNDIVRTTVFPDSSRFNGSTVLINLTCFSLLILLIIKIMCKWK